MILNILAWGINKFLRNNVYPELAKIQTSHGIP